MKKKWTYLLASATLVATSVFMLVGCVPKHDESWRTSKLYDLALPNLTGATTANPNEAGWYLTLADDFNGNALNESTIAYDEVGGVARNTATSPVWTFSPHAKRADTNDKNHPEYTSYWCDDMVTVKDGFARIYARQESTHVCQSSKCKATAGRFTGGFETRAITSDPENNKGNSDDILFGQAYGYYETRVKFPKADGLWSAFWLQSSTQRKLSAEGVDGTEIDIFESAFIKNPTHMGNALLWNGYGNPLSKVDDYINDTKTDLYDGFHTFALKWTPEYYVFYVDGVVNWASMGGGVARVKEFLRFTVEIDNGDAWGPHGQKIGQFKDNNTEFLVDYVKVYQNTNYLNYVIDADKFPGDLDFKN